MNKRSLERILMELLKRSLAGLKQMVTGVTAPLMMKPGEIGSSSAVLKLKNPNDGLIINDEGLELLKSFESLRLEAYQDEGGIWTIGYGCTGNVKPGDKITEEDAEKLLLRKLGFFEHGVSHCIHIPLNSNEFSALICLVYNIGIGALEKSRLVSLLNKNDRKSAADEFLEYRNMNGKFIPGLLRRRIAEMDLFLKPIRSQLD